MTQAKALFSAFDGTTAAEAEAEAQDDDGSEGEEKGSKEAVEAADKVKEKMLTAKTWPDPYQKWLKGLLKKGDDGVKELIEALVGKVMAKASEELKQEVQGLLEASDFGDLARGLFHVALRRLLCEPRRGRHRRVGGPWVAPPRHVGRDRALQ